MFTVRLDSLSEEDQKFAKENGLKTKSARMHAAVDRINRAVADGLGVEGMQLNEKLNDHMFLRRIYLDLSGTIPTYEEARDFLDDRDKNKRETLIKKLLDSEGYTSHLYNYLADLLRVQSTVPGTILRNDAYIDWIKTSLRENKPFDKMVYEMVSAEGRLWDNPAAGYHLRDNGTKLDHVSYMTKIFLGTDISCAQCHDDPFKDWTQYDYYQLTAYLGEVETKGKVPMKNAGKNKKNRGRYGINTKELDDYLKKRYKIDTSDERGKQRLRGMRNRYTRAYRDMFRANELVVHNNKGKDLRLPFSYQYDDHRANSIVEPRPLFGDAPESTDDKTRPQVQLAEWLTSPNNPRFAANIANRMWARFFGRGVAEPLHDIDPETSSNPELLQVLAEEMVNLDFNLKDFANVIVHTDAYNRLSSREKTPGSDPYYFPGPELRRMTSEQIWDSLVTLMVEDPMRYRSGAGEEYQKIINLVASQPANITEAVARADKLRGYKPESNLTDSSGQSVLAASAKGAPKKGSKKKGSSSSEADDDEMMMMMMNAAAKKRMILARASELQQPAPRGHFLDKFGQSDRNFVVGASTLKGSVPQVMELMNGYATEILTNPNSRLFQKMKEEKRDVGKQADVVFLSLLSRRMLFDERRALTEELSNGGTEAMSDLIWALLNTPEFLFIK